MPLIVHRTLFFCRQNVVAAKEQGNLMYSPLAVGTRHVRFLNNSPEIPTLPIQFFNIFKEQHRNSIPTAGYALLKYFWTLAHVGGAAKPPTRAIIKPPPIQAH